MTGDLSKAIIHQWWNLSEHELLAKLNVDSFEGLSEKEAQRRLKSFGENAIKVPRRFLALRLLISQFNTPLIYLLLFASMLSLFFKDQVDAFIIFVIIFASGFLSFIQEKNALQAMDKLLELIKIKTKVVREKKERSISIEKVVPGDIVHLKAGDMIPGDCYVLHAKSLNVDESTLTGESFYVDKTPGTTSKDCAINNRSNSLFMGTHVVSGIAKAVVVNTGKNTEFGKISEKLNNKPSETDFERGIRRLGYFLLEIILILLPVIFAFNVYFERPVIESILFALALAVGLTPQLLPAIISVNLARGARLMAQKSVIVKRLASIENFGSMNILCADKTGTLTTGKIKLEKIGGMEGKENPKTILYAFLNASFQSSYDNPIDKEIVKHAQTPISDWKLLEEIPYDFERKRITILAKNKNAPFLITKGAFHEILKICSYAETEEEKEVDITEVSKKLNSTYDDFCKEGYRVLAIAYKKLAKEKSLSVKDEKEMIFLGFLLFIDPLKPQVEETVKDLKEMGVSLKVITGDTALVALHLARHLNLSEENVLTGSQLNKMNDYQLAHCLKNISIYAEIEPNQKERIILALRKVGNVVGFLGDGINDVTALHAADVSISVESGSDAAKEVSDFVLLKKDLSVLKEGVMAGRVTLMNTLKYMS
jgi:P-type Mg2+ transporter